MPELTIAKGQCYIHLTKNYDRSASKLVFVGTYQECQDYCKANPAPNGYSYLIQQL